MNLVPPKVFIEAIQQTPLDGKLHLDYSKHLTTQRSDFLAFAEYRSACFLGESVDNDYECSIKKNLPDLQEMDYNQYFRLQSLTNYLDKLKNEAKPNSVLDVGGGYGQLAAFLSEDYDYCLAEPTTNGFDGRDLPFNENAFDYVVAAHVLEHISPEDRDRFLNSLVRIAKRAVILIGPFEIEGTKVEERLKLAYEITQQDWVKEHMECGLPTVDSVKDYAKRHQKSIQVQPNGSMLTAMTYMYMGWFAAMAKQRDDYKKLNKFYNQNYFELSTHDEYPVEFIVELSDTPRR